MGAGTGEAPEDVAKFEAPLADLQGVLAVLRPASEDKFKKNPEPEASAERVPGVQFVDDVIRDVTCAQRARLATAKHVNSAEMVKESRTVERPVADAFGPIGF